MELWLASQGSLWAMSAAKHASYRLRKCALATTPTAFRLETSNGRDCWQALASLPSPTRSLDEGEGRKKREKKKKIYNIWSSSFIREYHGLMLF
jgi:hypothetical protein